MIRKKVYLKLGDAPKRQLNRQNDGPSVFGSPHFWTTLKYWFVGDVTILVDYDPTVGWLKLSFRYPVLQVKQLLMYPMTVSIHYLWSPSCWLYPHWSISSHINPFPWHYFDHLIRGMGWSSHCIPIRSQLQLKSIIFDGEYILIIFNDYPCLNCTKTSYETTIKPPFLALGHGQKTIHRVYRTSSGLWHAPWRHASCSHGLWLPVRLAAASGV